MAHKVSNLTASIKYGPHLKTAYSGHVRYLKGQHFNEDGALLDADDSYVPSPTTAKLKKNLLEGDQLLLAGKGNRHFAWAYRQEAGPCIASSLFYVLTVKTKLVDSRYLAIVLNTASRGRALMAIAKGATVPVIPKRELLNLTVPVPNLEEQRKIIHLKELQDRRTNLLREITQLSATLDGAHIEQLINEA